MLLRGDRDFPRGFRESLSQGWAVLIWDGHASHVTCELVLQGYSCLHSISFSILLFHVDSLLLGLPSIVPRYHPHIFSLQILNPKTLSPKPCVVRSAFVSRSSRRQSSLQFTLAAPHHATQAPHDCSLLGGSARLSK